MRRRSNRDISVAYVKHYSTGLLRTRADNAHQLLWAELIIRFVRSFCNDWAPFGQKLLSFVWNRVVTVRAFLLQQWIFNQDFGKHLLYYYGCLQFGGVVSRAPLQCRMHV